MIPDSGEAGGINVGTEFQVYQDKDSGHLLGTVVARELSTFSTTLYAKDSRFALERDGVALKSRTHALEAGAEHGTTVASLQLIS